MDDIVLNKAAVIERCVARVHEEYAGDPKNLRESLTRQDSIILNIQRACEAAIDLAMHLVRKRALGVPQETRDAFRFLVEAGELEPELAAALQRMVGFRNIAVHDYQALNLEIVQAIVEKHLGELRAFASQALSRYG